MNACVSRAMQSLLVMAAMHTCGWMSSMAAGVARAMLGSNRWWSEDRVVMLPNAVIIAHMLVTSTCGWTGNRDGGSCPAQSFQTSELNFELPAPSFSFLYPSGGGDTHLRLDGEPWRQEVPGTADGQPLRVHIKLAQNSGRVLVNKDNLPIKVCGRPLADMRAMVLLWHGWCTAAPVITEH